MLKAEGVKAGIHNILRGSNHMGETSPMARNWMVGHYNPLNKDNHILLVPGI